MKNNKKIDTYCVDVCVVGGGFAGICAAVSAARHGAKVVLINDRPVLGGNASSEIRMWPLGARGTNRRETGIFEEIVLENMYLNPTRNYPLWDAVLFGIVKGQENLTCILNCSVNEVEMNENKISSVTGWQLTTYRYKKVNAKIFIDCSGDSIVAELSGAEYRIGREARAEFGEAAAPEVADSCTMGNSCMIQARETDTPIVYKAPSFATKMDDDERLKNRRHDLGEFEENFWWLELGGERDSVNECEEIRDELVALSFGIWDHIKNHGDHGAENWELDWAGFLPGKRESKRCIGDHILNQAEVVANTMFEDIIAYGGWPIDDHNPLGFNNVGRPNINHPCPSPFAIPYRTLYSVNIENLMFAGRNISVTHAAMASSRVMATCGMLGQAAGTAASIAAEKDCTPRDVNKYIKDLQSMLMEDDCWLPGLKREISAACLSAELTAESADKGNLRNGLDRPTDEEGDNGCYLPIGTAVKYTLKNPEFVKKVRIIFDSDLDRKTVKGGLQSIKDKPTICNKPVHFESYTFPSTMVKSFKILVDGKEIFTTAENRKRCVFVDIGEKVSEIELIPTETYGDNSAHIFSFDFE